MRDITLGETHDFKFTTCEPDTGAPATLSGTPVISAYVDNSTTQITAGITLSVDFDGVTGLNNVRVVATSGNGYATGTSVALIITTGTVDSVSAVGYKVGEFSIGRAAAFTRLGAPAGASVSADVAAVKVDTAAILVDTGTTLDARIPAALVSGRMDCSVGAMAANVLTATAINADAITAAKLAADVTTELQSGLATAAAVADLPTNAELATALGAADDAVLAAIAALNNLSAAQVNAEVDTAISDAALATAANLATVDTVVDAIKAKTDSLTFTVAGTVDANITHVIADPVQVNGADDTNWGGAP
jgi:hypothetical protein